MSESSHRPQRQPLPSPPVVAARIVDEAGRSCTSCATARSFNAKYCPECGKDLAITPARPAEPDAAPPMAAMLSANTPTLPVGPAPDSRDTQHEPPISVSPRAPKEAMQSDQSLKCDCGTAMPLDAQFCSRCGKRVGEARPQYRLRRMLPDGSKDMGRPLVDELTIGKTPECDVVIPDDDYVSRRHARLFRSDGLVFLEDLGSSTGTLLRIHRPIVLEIGDEIVLGSNVLCLDQS